jgi:hypothetical protein
LNGKEDWVGTEQVIDCFVVLDYLARTTNEQRFIDAAGKAKNWLLTVAYDKNRNRLLSGQYTINDERFATDVYAWFLSVPALRDALTAEQRAALIETMEREGKVTVDGMTGFNFTNLRATNISYEWTGWASIMYGVNGREETREYYVREMSKAANKDNSMPYSSGKGVNTGLDPYWNTPNSKASISSSVSRHMAYRKVNLLDTRTDGGKNCAVVNFNSFGYDMGMVDYEKFDLYVNHMLGNGWYTVVKASAADMATMARAPPAAGCLAASALTTYDLSIEPYDFVSYSYIISLLNILSQFPETYRGRLSSETIAAILEGLSGALTSKGTDPSVGAFYKLLADLLLTTRPTVAGYLVVWAAIHGVPVTSSLLQGHDPLNTGDSILNFNAELPLALISTVAGISENDAATVGVRAVMRSLLQGKDPSNVANPNKFYGAYVSGMGRECTDGGLMMAGLIGLGIVAGGLAIALGYVVKNRLEKDETWMENHARQNGKPAPAPKPAAPVTPAAPVAQSAEAPAATQPVAPAKSSRCIL